jgi:hypothetical protein
VELYCHELDYNKASFSMEEALIHHPHNHLYHQRYAEIRYAMGGYENIETSRTHFAKAVQLCRSNTDALYGMCIVRLIDNLLLSKLPNKVNIPLEILFQIFFLERKKVSETRQWRKFLKPFLRRVFQVFLEDFSNQSINQSID